MCEGKDVVYAWFGERNYLAWFNLPMKRPMLKVNWQVQTFTSLPRVARVEPQFRVCSRTGSLFVFAYVLHALSQAHFFFYD
jgi:hypothetical protein